MATRARITVTLPPESDDGQPRTLTLRPLWAWETHLVQDTFPRPSAPWIRDPTKGSRADPIPDEQNPKHQAALRVWLRKTQLAEIHLAMQPEADRTTDGARLEAAVGQLAERYTADELGFVWVQSRQLQTRGLVADAMKYILVARDPATPPAADDDGGVSIPEQYDLGERALLYRAACRAGQNPHAWPDSLTPEQRAETIAHELVFIREEQERLGLLRAVASMAGG